jgi:hypothetical protein
MRRFGLLIFIASLLLTSCNWFTGLRHGFRYPNGSLPEDPVNLQEFNSTYNDYNSDTPIRGRSGHLIFSTDRASEGAQFDLYFSVLEIYFNRSDGTLIVQDGTHGINQSIANTFKPLKDAVLKVNSPSANEFGPHIVRQGRRVDKPYYYYVLMYATDLSGNLDIRFTHNLTDDVFCDPVDVSFLNSPYNDAYPVFSPDTSYVYFCSDREGNYDIYRADLNKNGRLTRALEDPTPRTIIKIDNLCSESNEKCPFIMGDVMVFASDRPEGYGGYDLYYSLFENGTWSDPVNFGSRINTPYNEFRPVLKYFYFEDFTNDFMLFSSDRPGGKGGFDLYYVGIPRFKIYENYVDFD